ncbi:hypothetical protein Shyd_00050 [Streptomyces hydrogenans]|uniref:BPP domain-containing protein n=1 Tax=Streptomyces hydrogenans TaxID=1873719 RepID=A0ABQ3P0T8_9ACTN|nr:hypothetical protein Shyd_00050 [Streptomyces hydrogenans]
MTIRLAVRASTLALCTTLAASLALPAQASGIDSVHPKAETAPLFDDETGGNANADDPAIWRNTAAPGRSLVIATAKQGGLRVYDWRAGAVDPRPAGPSADDKPGRFNNVDLVHGLRGGTRADVAVVSDRGNDRLRIYRIDRDRSGGPLTDITAPAARPVFSADQDEINEQKTAYGLATLDRPRHRPLLRAGQPAQPHPDRPAGTAPPPRPAPSTTARSAPSTCRPPSGLPNGATGRPCAEPGELPQSRAWLSTPRTAPCTRDRRTSASGASTRA